MSPRKYLSCKKNLGAKKLHFLTKSDDFSGGGAFEEKERAILILEKISFEVGSSESAKKSKKVPRCRFIAPQ